ncbi:uncharacterized protein LOC135473764 [Liolophura sinensis]|uniref:uncharacterized protein LOC135473764 n=1 Tax=Liolophura sinensis TaxID=3198878 RepID=UPI003158FA5A
MGSSSSKKGPRPQPVRPADHGPLPQELVPYAGPQIQYRIVQMMVNFKSHVTFGFTQGVPQTTTNVDDYYPTLGAQYGEGFTLISFYRIPGGAQQTGLFSMTVAIPFQGIFSCCPSVPTHERWQLRIEKSAMYVHAMTSVRIFRGATTQSAANTSHLIDMISSCTATGGRLICVEMTGMMSAQGMQMGLTSSSMQTGVGVDLFFNMPLHPNPTVYIYQCVNTPIPMTMTPGFGQVTVDIQFNFMGHLAVHLNQGYRLVEIFYDQSAMSQIHGGFMPTTGMSMNTIWFFEKEADRVNDITPVYEGCIVEYYLKIQPGLGQVVASANWAPLMENMGNKGWELACTLETPKIVRSGMMTMKQTILLFFQRKILTSNSASGMPPSHIGLVDPSTGAPMATEYAPPPSYDEVAKQ